VASKCFNLAKFISVAEKSRYPFKAYPRVRCETVLFCGCAMPSQYPRTTDALVQLAREHGAGVVHDCCGKPLDDWGEQRRAARIAVGLRRRLGRIGCRRLVVACPNCLEYLRQTIGAGIECVSVFEQLAKWGFEPGRALGTGPNARHATGGVSEALCPPVARGARAMLYIPCPDRASRGLERQYRALDPAAACLETMHGVPCCGLRADVVGQGAAVSAAAARRVLEVLGACELHTYCAACAGQFVRVGAEVPVRHVLSTMLGIDEIPQANRALLNRALRKFDRNLAPLTCVDTASSSVISNTVSIEAPCASHKACDKGAACGLVADASSGEGGPC